MFCCCCGVGVPLGVRVGGGVEDMGDCSAWVSTEVDWPVVDDDDDDDVVEDRAAGACDDAATPVTPDAVVATDAEDAVVAAVADWDEGVTVPLVEAVEEALTFDTVLSVGACADPVVVVLATVLARDVVVACVASACGGADDVDDVDDDTAVEEGGARMFEGGVTEEGGEVMAAVIATGCVGAEGDGADVEPWGSWEACTWKGEREKKAHICSFLSTSI